MVVEAATSAMVVAMHRVVDSGMVGEAVDSVRGRRSEPMQPKDMSTAMIVRPTLSLALLFCSSRNRTRRVRRFRSDSGHEEEEAGRDSVRTAVPIVVSTNRSHRRTADCCVFTYRFRQTVW